MKVIHSIDYFQLVFLYFLWYFQVHVEFDPKDNGLDDSFRLSK